MAIHQECIVQVEPSVKAKNLINNTYESMMKGIDSVKPGVKLGDLGFHYTRKC